MRRHQAASIRARPRVLVGEGRVTFRQVGAQWTGG